MKPVTFGRALGLGARTAFARAVPPLLVALAAAGGTLASTLLWSAGLAALFDARVRTLVVPGLLVAALVAWVLQAAVLGGAVLQATATLRGRPALPLGEAIRAAAPRALGWAALAAAALLAWTGWQVLLTGSALLLFVRGLFVGSGGLTGALGLALVGALGPLGGIGLEVLAEMALVRSVARDEPAAVAGWEAARALLVRPWAPLGLWALTALLVAATAGSVATISGMAPAGDGPVATPLFLVRVAIVALAGAVALLLRLFAFVALELDRAGELPAPPAPSVPPRPPIAELVLDATPVLEARAVGPGPGSSG